MNLFDYEVLFSFLRIYIFMSVKVGVRVRAFTQKEKDNNSKLCISMMENKTIIFHPEGSEGKYREFTLDYAFWSHDQFIVTPNGYFAPQSEKYADQRQVFERVGLQILQNLWEGYHCCLFAYGQTGAGKKYLLWGNNANKGIIPNSCEEIFKKLSTKKEADKEYQIKVSMMEIYNQKIQDLLKPHSQSQSCKVKQDKIQGVYVQGLTKLQASSLESIQGIIQKGIKNKHIGITYMSKASSRITTIITIQLRQLRKQLNGHLSQKLSRIQFVQLAGSQKISKTGLHSAELSKQVSRTVKSLTTLGLIIHALGERASGKKNHIPYRDSCLTRVLQNSLGGNCKTYMICVIAPSAEHYQETLSTLRYAERARRIANTPVVNEKQVNETQQKPELQMQKIETQKFIQIGEKIQINQMQLGLLQKLKTQKALKDKFQAEKVEFTSISQKDQNSNKFEFDNFSTLKQKEEQILVLKNILKEHFLQKKKKQIQLFEISLKIKQEQQIISQKQKQLEKIRKQQN